MALAVIVSFIALSMLNACASKDNNAVHWQQDRTLVLNTLQDMQKSSGAAQGRLVQLNIQIATLQTILQKMQMQQGALAARLQLQNNKLNTIEAAHLAEAKEISVQTSPAALSKKINKKSLLKKVQALDHNAAMAELVLSNPSHEKKRRKTSAEEKNTYTAAYLAYKSGRFNDAIASFQLLLNEYAEGEYADSGYYWLAESLLAQKQYRKSLDVFIFYTTHYPKSGKLSAAMLGMARAQLALKKNPHAKKTLTQLIQLFPASTAADQGRVLLSSLIK
ncbi:MAG: tetratricopeptide repeat protein [Mariprofundaceae bacterium]|nr:tetratricopeptide repeat protein [Mariprofundaceae bacterium]